MFDNCLLKLQNQLQSYYILATNVPRVSTHPEGDTKLQMFQIGSNSPKFISLKFTTLQFAILLYKS